MAGFMMKPLVLLSLGQLLAQLGGAAVLPQNERSALEIGTNGALLRREAPSAEHTLQHLFKKSQETLGGDTCNDNYMAGAEGDVDCSTNMTDSTDKVHTSTNPAMLYRIQEPDMCQEAAKEDCKAKNATCVSDATKDKGCEEDCVADPFVIDACYYNNFPIGCFMRSNGKWGYNDAGDMPTKLGEKPRRLDGSDYPNGACPLTPAEAASPVCQRIEYINGTLDAGIGSCPTDFAVIMNEDNCRTAATCLGFCSEDQFRVIAVNNSFPDGCFIAASGCARFNNIPAQDPALVTGTPLCNLTLARGSENAGAGGAAPATPAADTKSDTK